MKKGSIRNHTKEEVQEYVKLLREAFKDKSKVNEALSYENTSLLQSYLFNMGVNPELLEYAAVVEYVREDLRKVLTEAEKCNITEKGIDSIFYSYSKEGSQIKAEVNGGILSSRNARVNNPKENGEVVITELISNIVINKFGAVEYNGYVGMFAGEYSERSRKQEHGKPIAVVEASDGATYGYERKLEDFGNPLDPSNQERDFKENYELFGGLYPRLQKWYEYYFPIYNKSIEEYSDMLKDNMLDIEIKELEAEIKFYQKGYLENVAQITKKSFKVGKMVGFVKSVKDKSPIGKKVAEKVLDKVRKIEKPQKDKEAAEEAIPECETKEQKKARLQRKLERLKEKCNYSSRQKSYLNRVIQTIEQELDKIPLIGGAVNKAAENYRGRRVDLDDEPIV